MNERKLKQLFETARRDQPPAPSEDFDHLVMSAIGHGLEREPVSLVDQLSLLFPRLAMAAVAVIGLCIAGDFLMTAFHLPGLTDGMTQLSDQWLLIPDGI